MLIAFLGIVSWLFQIRPVFSAVQVFKYSFHVTVKEEVKGKILQAAAAPLNATRIA
jgi:hypothetical protein